MAANDESAIEVPQTPITYPFKTDIPEPGKVIEVADGIFWLRMPLPFSLDHINLWLLRDGDGWTIVDTGYRGENVRELWEEVFENTLDGKPVTRIIVTHYHPDHVGQAGWLARKFDAPLCMARTEYLLCKSLFLDKWDGEPPQDTVRFYERAGFNEEQMSAWRDRQSAGFASGVTRLPNSIVRLQDRDKVAIDGLEWEVIIGRGHSPEHVCLFSPDKGVMFSGDQVLPRISSNVSVFPTEPDGDPLSEWLDSCSHIPTRIPEDTLILPAHNRPFVGAHKRLQDLINGHEEGLAKLYELCAEPKRVVDCFPALFKKEIKGRDFFLAVGESMSHLNCLISRGKIVRILGEDGVYRYQQA